MQMPKKNNKQTEEEASRLKKITSICLLCLLIFPISISVLSRGNDVTQAQLEQAENFFSVSARTDTPCTKADGSKFTIGYLDIDPYPETGAMLYYFVEQLRTNGWITYDGELPFDPANIDAKELINYLAKQDLGPYIQFSDEVNYYVSDSYDGAQFVKRDLKKHIQDQDVDLLFCLGTQPADIVINEMGVDEVPIMVSGTVDPVSAGLCEAEDYSGRKNVWCHTNSEVYRSQLKYYHDSYPFTNIGMVFYDEVIGSYGPYSETAKELGVKITYRKIGRDVTDDYYDKLRKIYTELANSGIDAFLLNSDIIKDEKQIAPLLDIFYDKDIPVFVQNSEYYVADGATMVVTASDARTQAPFLADAFSQILHGEKPENVRQKFVTPPYLSLNLESAKRADFEVDADMLLSAEKLYTKTKR